MPLDSRLAAKRWARRSRAPSATPPRPRLRGSPRGEALRDREYRGDARTTG